MYHHFLHIKVNSATNRIANIKPFPSNDKYKASGQMLEWEGGFTLPQKIVINLPWTYDKLQCKKVTYRFKGQHDSSVHTYRHTKTSCNFYTKKIWKIKVKHKKNNPQRVKAISNISFCISHMTLLSDDFKYLYTKINQIKCIHK